VLERGIDNFTPYANVDGVRGDISYLLSNEGYRLVADFHSATNPAPAEA
jgi:hypothetical protein